MPVLLAAPTGDFGTIDDARKAAVADADNPKIGPVDSIIIEPILVASPEARRRWREAPGKSLSPVGRSRASPIATIECSRILG